MDKLNHYQTLIKSILMEYNRISGQVPEPGIEEKLIFDDEHSQYVWFNLGWKGSRRISAVSVYVQIKNGKIYIEEDWTEAGIATDLLAKSVPASDIVLAFQPPEAREFTEFAMA